MMIFKIKINILKINKCVFFIKTPEEKIGFIEKVDMDRLIIIHY